MRYRKLPTLNEIRLVGRLVSDPEPEDEGVSLRLMVRYGAEVHERTVLATGAGAKAARDLRAGDLVYVVGRRADDEAEHEIEAEHVLAKEPVDQEEIPALSLPF
ncbi:MAG: hypothetical protein ACREK5_03855 [Gemmatimonadota bacterium]